uniref:Uncharacterized protein n=1 Tax=Cucumis melo TaxID=3656 RepID=A0A9I9CYN6_CUCME
MEERRCDGKVDDDERKLGHDNEVFEVLLLLFFCFVPQRRRKVLPVPDTISKSSRIV